MESLELYQMAAAFPRLQSFSAMGMVCKLASASAAAQQEHEQEELELYPDLTVDSDAEEGQKEPAVDGATSSAAAIPAACFAQLTHLKLDGTPLLVARHAKNSACRPPADIPGALAALLPRVTALSMSESCTGWDFRALLPQLEVLTMDVDQVRLLGDQPPEPAPEALPALLEEDDLVFMPEPVMSALGRLRRLELRIADEHLGIRLSLPRGLASLLVRGSAWQQYGDWGCSVTLDTSAHPGLKVSYDPETLDLSMHVPEAPPGAAGAAAAAPPAGPLSLAEAVRRGAILQFTEHCKPLASGDVDGDDEYMDEADDDYYLADYDYFDDEYEGSDDDYLMGGF